MFPLPAWRPTLAAIACAFLAFLLVVQTVRIEGFKVWPLHVRGYKGKLADIEQRIALDKAAQAERERTATTTLRTEEQRAAAAATQRRKDIDDATAGIPDQAPSARQKARACVELRRQGKSPKGC